MIRNICVGFAGKREVSDEDKIVLSRLKDIFYSFDKHFVKTGFRFCSGLADGADQIASQLFLDTKLSLENENCFSINSIIPFCKSDYLHTIENKDVFLSLYDKCLHSVQLDGRYLEGDEGKWGRAKAYNHQGKGLVMYSDVLIVAAYMKSDSISSSRETAITSLHKNVPVLFLNLEDGLFYFFNDLESWLEGARIPQSIDDIVVSLMEIVGGENVVDHVDEGALLKRDTLAFKLRKRVWGMYEGLFKIDDDGSEKSGYVRIANAFSDKIMSIRKTSSEATNYYQIQYRGGYMLNYLLAILAVFIGVVSITIYIYIAKHKVGHDGYFLIIALGIIKIFLIFIMVNNTKTVNSELYNKRAIDYRYVSERLRLNYYLSFFGFLRAPKPSLGGHIQDYLKKYTGEIIHQAKESSLYDEKWEISLTRESLIENISFIRDSWINGQVLYHKKENKRMFHMHEFLEHCVESLGKTVIFLLFIEVIGLIIYSSFSEHSLISIISPLIMGCTILIPAVITTLNSILFQTEAKKIAFRSQLIYEKINILMKELDERKRELLEGANNLRYDGSRTIEIVEILNKVAQIATDEVAEWSLLYEKPVFEQG